MVNSSSLAADLRLYAYKISHDVCLENTTACIGTDEDEDRRLMENPNLLSRC